MKICYLKEVYSEEPCQRPTEDCDPCQGPCTLIEDFSNPCKSYQCVPRNRVNWKNVAITLLSTNAVLGLSYFFYNTVSFSCKKHNRIEADVEANQEAGEDGVDEAEEACEEQVGIENPHAAVDFNNFGEMEED